MLIDKKNMIPWEESYSVGIQEIDKQHQHFFDLINKLYGVFLTDFENRGKIEEVLDELVKYKETHFATEEKYFDQFGYPEAAEHKAEHEKLRAEIKKFQDRFAKEGAEIIRDFLDFLENWLVDHLSNQDKKYAQFFKEHGLQ